MSGPDWVTARFKCTLDSNFCAIISRIKADVAEFNELSGKQRFEATLNGDDTLTVRRWVHPEGGRAYTDSDSQISVSCAGKVIRARGKGLHVEIAPTWNPETRNCDLIVDAEALPLCRISETIIGDFLFGG